MLKIFTLSVNKKKAVRIVCTVLTVALVLFIWRNSLKDAVESTVESKGVMEIMQRIIDAVIPNVKLTDHIVRKSAHFAEFFVLGAFLLCMVKLYKNKIKRCLLIFIGIGFLIPVIDENIQKFSEGRSCLISDVILDIVGIAAGMAAGWLIYIAWRKLCSRRIGK